VGVTVFFVLSGFLITRLLIEEHVDRRSIDLSAFFRRRARRLLPAAAMFLAFAGTANHVAGTSWWPTLASATYLANVATLLGVQMHFLQHLWSLSMEEQFYLVWPALLGWLLSRRPRWLVPLLVAAVLACTLLRVGLLVEGTGVPRIMFGPDTRSDALAIGALLALALPRMIHWHWGPMAAGGTAVIVLCVPIGSYGVWTLLPVALAAATLVGWAATGPTAGAGDTPTRRVCAALGRGPLALLGRISYGVYLWHFPFAILLSVRMPSVPAAVITLGLSTAIAAVSWHFVEEPFLRHTRRYAARSR
jgi:peptidoglycan/LPS O-acetylase OafA/YrhL